jgi:Ring finger domain
MPTIEDDDGMCPICCGTFREVIRLSCGHSVHSRCLLDWWGKSYDNSFSCPFCRSVETNVCFIEVVRNAKLPYAIGFFWNDDDIERNIVEKLVYHDRSFLTKILKIPKDGANRLKSYINFLKSMDIVMDTFGLPDQVVTSYEDEVI